jgi:hypothetical protein
LQYNFSSLWLWDSPLFIVLLFKKIIHLFTCAYIVWVISTPCPTPLPFPLFPHSVPVLSLSLILLKKRQKPNKEDKVFLIVELRIAIQKYSYHCFRVHVLWPMLIHL